MSKNKEHQKEAKKLRKRLSKRKKLIIGAVVVVLIVAVGFTAWYFYQKNKSISIPTPTIMSMDTLNQTMSDAQALADNGDFSGAKAAYDIALTQTNDSFQKSMLLSSEATIYFNDSNYNQALVIALQAEAANENRTITDFIAQIYAAKGDKQKAIEYYQKTIKLVNDSNEPFDGTQHYQDMIDELNNGTTN